MHPTLQKSNLLRQTLNAAAWLALSLGAQAQNTTTLAGPAPAQDLPTPLRQAFEAAWSRQPEALALQARRDAAAAQRRAVQSWTPEAPALEVSNKTDRLTRNQGARELEVGVAVPLWLPGERGRAAALADAEGAAIDSRTLAARLRVAATVREAWWNWQRARVEADIARDPVDNARRIAADVARRLKAWDLARADQHQADGAVAAAESNLAQADAGIATAAQRFKALTGLVPGTVPGSLPGAVQSAGAHQAEPLPDASAAAPLESHAALAELRDRAEVSERAVALATAQSRANPELTLATTRDRGAFGERYGQTITLAVRIPFGSGPRHEAKLATARADVAEARAQIALESERQAAEREATRGRVDAAGAQLAAAERRAQLARESRGFFDKSFRLGETDLPTRLRIEAEATDAERQAARIRIELAAAISAWRQALGLLPQ